VIFGLRPPKRDHNETREAFPFGLTARTLASSADAIALMGSRRARKRRTQAPAIRLQTGAWRYRKGHLPAFGNSRVREIQLRAFGDTHDVVMCVLRGSHKRPRAAICAGDSGAVLLRFPFGSAELEPSGPAPRRTCMKRAARWSSRVDDPLNL
jgi:hypothetical protein